MAYTEEDAKREEQERLIATVNKQLSQMDAMRLRNLYNHLMEYETLLMTDPYYAEMQYGPNYRMRVLTGRP